MQFIVIPAKKAPLGADASRDPAQEACEALDVLPEAVKIDRVLRTLIVLVPGHAGSMPST